MPLTAIPYQSLADEKLAQQVKKLYDVSPEFADGDSALSAINTMLSKGSTLYLGMFNDKPIAGIMVRGVSEVRLMQYIVIHPANRGRGLASIFLKDVGEQEKQKGVIGFEAGCGVIHKTLTKLDMLKY